MIKQIKTAILVFIVLTIITGIFYPLVITGIAQLCFSKKANGSLIYRDNKPIGSSLIGQNFNAPQYFCGRLSATSPAAFNAASSSGSNLGPLNPILHKSIEERINMLKSFDQNNRLPVPVDLVTSSASGLDPDISLAAAYYQIPRVARLRNLQQDAVNAIVHQHAKRRFLGVIGEPVVNVLELNLAMDEYKK